MNCAPGWKFQLYPWGKHLSWWSFQKALYLVNMYPVDEVVEEALCFGWIDSLPRKYGQVIAPCYWAFSVSRPGSRWSRLNKQRVEIVAELLAVNCENRKAGGHRTCHNPMVHGDMADKAWMPWLFRMTWRRLWQKLLNCRGKLPGVQHLASRRAILWWIASAQTGSATRQKRYVPRL